MCNYDCKGFRHLLQRKLRLRQLILSCSFEPSSGLMIWWWLFVYMYSYRREYMAICKHVYKSTCIGVYMYTCGHEYMWALDD